MQCKNIIKRLLFYKFCEITIFVLLLKERKKILKLIESTFIGAIAASMHIIKDHYTRYKYLCLHSIILKGSKSSAITVISDGNDAW